MIHLPASVRVYLCLTPCDMRKSFDSLQYQSLLRELLEAQRNRKSEQLSKEQRALFEAA